MGKRKVTLSIEKEVLREAKKLSYRTGGTDSTLDYMVIKDSSPLSTSIDELRRKEYVYRITKYGESIELTCRPYIFNDFKDKIYKMVNALVNIPNTQLHIIADALKDNPRIAQVNIAYQIVRNRSHWEKFSKELINKVDLEKIIVSILDILKEKINEKKLKINVEIEEGLIKILADRSVVSISLFTLIENAVLYNRIGGQVNIKIQKLAQRPYLEIIVEDTGIGMTKKDLANLFKKYYRGEKAKELDIKGFGIGLYNVKNLINLHGGEIKIESEENKGTKATITLPLDLNLIPGYKVRK